MGSGGLGPRLMVGARDGRLMVGGAVGRPDTVAPKFDPSDEPGGVTCDKWAWFRVGREAGSEPGMVETEEAESSAGMVTATWPAGRV